MPQVINKPAAGSAPKSAADYQAEAFAADAAASKSSQATPAPAESGGLEPSAKVESGVTGTEPKTDPPAAEIPEGKKKAEAPTDVPDGIKRSFEKLAQEKADFRKEKESLLTENKTLKEQAAKAQALAEAKSPMALLKAAGFTWKDAVQEITGQRPDGDDDEPAPAPKTEKKLKLEDLDPDAARELAEWRAERARTARAEGRKAISAKIEEYAKGVGKYDLVLKLGEMEKVMGYIDAHFDKYKELPGSTFEESVSIALAAVQEDLMKQAERFKKAGILTGGTEGATDEGAADNREEAAPRPTSDQGGSKTLTTKAGAPRTGPPPEKPKTSEDYIAQAVAELERLEKGR